MKQAKTSTMMVVVTQMKMMMTMVMVFLIPMTHVLRLHVVQKLIPMAVKRLLLILTLTVWPTALMNVQGLNLEPKSIGTDVKSIMQWRMTTMMESSIWMTIALMVVQIGLRLRPTIMILTVVKMQPKTGMMTMTTWVTKKICAQPAL